MPFIRLDLVDDREFVSCALDSPWLHIRPIPFTMYPAHLKNFGQTGSYRYLARSTDGYDINIRTFIHRYHPIPIFLQDFLHSADIVFSFLLFIRTVRHCHKKDTATWHRLCTGDNQKIKFNGKLSYMLSICCVLSYLP